jgi:hypothetical protein
VSNSSEKDEMVNHLKDMGYSHNNNNGIHTLTKGYSKYTISGQPNNTTLWKGDMKSGNTLDSLKKHTERMNSSDISKKQSYVVKHASGTPGNWKFHTTNVDAAHADEAKSIIKKKHPTHYIETANLLKD